MIATRGFFFYNLVFVHALLLGHGFGGNTLIALADGSKRTIYSICLQSLKNRLLIYSYDSDNSIPITQHTIIGKKSRSNCYIRLGFDKNGDDDIFCTPTQEFYATHSNQWVSAYLLKIGDPFITKDGTSKILTYKKFIPKPLTIYMLEVENTHTFFVGRYSLLTHNMLLPLTASIGFVVSFGSVATGSVGSFFGPIGLIGGIAVGGLIGFAAKILYEKRIPCYKTPSFDVSLIHNNCHTTISSNDTLSKPSGCFEKQDLSHTTHIYPIERPIQTKVGCVEIQTYIPNKSNSNSCSKTEQPKINKQGCFQSAEQKTQQSSSSQEKLSDSTKDSSEKQYNGPWYNRTEDWIKDHPFGKKIAKSLERSQFTNQGKRAFEVIKNIENCDGFKKGDYIVVDAMHKDHLEVFGKDREWKSVANFDGTRNENKTLQGKRESRRKLK